MCTHDGRTTTARYFVSGGGTLSVPKTPDFPGVESFAGRTLLTCNWREDVDLAGMRVGIIGTGSSGIQAISEIAKQAGTLTVFQRTPNYATPIGNYATDPAGGADEEANETAAEYIRNRIRERVTNPATAELLCPTTYPYGTKRPPLETDYYEAFNRDTVSIVDVESNPIDAVVPEGVRLADGTVHELDVLVLATGFDACTGPLLAMNITGRGGVSLTEDWADGPQTYLGLTVSGFPNLFMVTGPQSPSVLYNMPLAIEDHIDLIADIITYMSDNGHTVVDPSEQAQGQWVAETNTIAEMTLLPTSETSWYMGANIPGKPRRVLVYLGGAPRYRAICDNVQRNDYRGFRFGNSSSEIDGADYSSALDPSFMFIVEALRHQEFTGFRAAGVEGARAVVDSFVDMQAPAKEVASPCEPGRSWSRRPTDGRPSTNSPSPTTTPTRLCAGPPITSLSTVATPLALRLPETPQAAISRQERLCKP